MISKFMTSNNTAKYIDALQGLIEIYNRTPHSSLLDYSPDEVLKDSVVRNRIQELNFEKMDYNKELIQSNLSKFSIGDDVRLKLKKRNFQKGYEQTYSSETYKVLGFKGNNVIIEKDERETIIPFNDVRLSFASQSQEKNTEKSTLDNLARQRARIAREHL